MASLNRLLGVLAVSLAFTIAGCTASDNLASKGQLIECQVAADGSTSNCQPVDQPSGSPGTCVDHDEDGDDDPHDEAEAEDPNDDHPSVTGDVDDDDDGTPDAEDDDDDNDGIDDDQDCDELPGADDDDSDD